MSEPAVESEKITGSTGDKIALPLFAISLLLLIVTGIAAWSMQRARDEAARLVYMSLERVGAIRDLEAAVHSLQSHLYAYARTRERQHLNAILGLRERTQQYLVRTERLFVTRNGKTYLAGLRQIYTRLDDGLDGLRNEAASPEDVASLLDENVADAMIEEARKQRAAQIDAMNHALADQDRMTRNATWALLGLGIFGSVSGAGLGMLISRRVNRSLMRLEVPVRNAAGQLNEVIGPIAVTGDPTSASLQERLNDVAAQVATVVERLQASEREGLRNDQLAAVGQMAAGLAHELRNPLTAMKTIVQTARSGADDLDERDLEVLEQEITRLNDSLQLFLDFARPPRLEKHRFDVNELVDNTVQLVSARARQQHVVIQQEVPADPLTVNADFDGLRQVLVNLLFNALDAMPDGGDVRVSVVANETEVVLTVADSGPGVDPEIADRIFEPFVSSREAGSGLGLSICQRIVEQHGGRVEVQSSPSGARFAVHLKRE